MTILPSLTAVGLAISAVLLSPPVSVRAQVVPGPEETRWQEAELDNLGNLSEEAVLDFLERGSDDFASIDLNTATPEALAALPGVDREVADRIVAFRERFGPFPTVEDIAAVDGVTMRSLRALRRFGAIPPPATTASTVASHRSGTTPRVTWTSTTLRALELAEGYGASDGFAGPPLRVSSGLEIQPTRRSKVYVVADQDAGEPLRWTPAGRTWGSDHLTGTVEVGSQSHRWHMVLGDYRADLGSGLLLGQPAFGADAVTTARRLVRPHVRLRPHRSTSEYGFQRGVAVRADAGRGLSGTVLVSRRRRDARPREPAGSAADVFPWTLQRTGYHRTASEQSARGALLEESTAAHVGVERTRWRVGLMGSGIQYRPIVGGLDVTPPTQRYRYRPVAGGYVVLSTDLWSVGVEPVYALGRGWAAALRVYAAPEPETRIGIEAVRIGSGFVNPRTGGLGSSLGVDEPIGIFRLGVHHRGRSSRIETTTQVTISPRPRGSLPYPSRRWTGRLRIEQSFGASVRLSARLTLRTVPTASWTHDELLRRIPMLGRQNSSAVSVGLTYRPSTRFRYRLQLRGVRVREHGDGSGSTTGGQAMLQDARWSICDGVDLDLRFAVFSTDDYDTRIYSLDPGLPNTFTLQALYGRGERGATRIRWAIGRALTIWATVGRTRYDHNRTSGTGLELVRAPTRTAVGAGVRLQR